MFFLSASVLSDSFIEIVYTQFMSYIFGLKLFLPHLLYLYSTFFCFCRRPSKRTFMVIHTHLLKPAFDVTIRELAIFIFISMLQDKQRVLHFAFHFIKVPDGNSQYNFV